jgi:hypothetical protein
MKETVSKLPIAFIALLAAAPAAASQPVFAQQAPPSAASVAPADGRARFQGLFVDWSSASRQSIDAERQAAARPPHGPDAAGTAPSAGIAAPGSVALGERVGDIVALGDCAEGERVARMAGDFALVAAVRDYCNAAAQGER